MASFGASIVNAYIFLRGIAHSVFPCLPLMIKFLCSRFFLGVLVGIPVSAIVYLRLLGIRSQFPSLGHFIGCVFLGAAFIGLICSGYNKISNSQLDVDMDMGLLFLIPVIALIVFFLIIYVIDHL